MWVINDMAILVSVTLERARVEWTNREPNFTERKNISLEDQTLQPNDRATPCRFARTSPATQTSLSRSHISRIATVGEPNMN